MSRFSKLFIRDFTLVELSVLYFEAVRGLGVYGLRQLGTGWTFATVTGRETGVAHPKVSQDTYLDVSYVGSSDEEGESDVGTLSRSNNPRSCRVGKNDDSSQRVPSTSPHRYGISLL